jgi:hypothetical protein
MIKIWCEVLNLSIFCAVLSAVDVMLCCRRRRPLSHTMALLTMWALLFFIAWWGVFAWPFGYN